MDSDYYLAPIDMSNLLFKVICLKTLIPNLLFKANSMGRFTRYVSNVVLNVNMFLVDISIVTPFWFELISENVSESLGIKQIQTITWHLSICQIYFLKQFV